MLLIALSLNCSSSSSAVPGGNPSGEMREGGRREEWTEEVTRECRIPVGRSSLARERGREGGGGLYMEGMLWLMVEGRGEDTEEVGGCKYNNNNMTTVISHTTKVLFLD